MSYLLGAVIALGLFALFIGLGRYFKKKREKDSKDNDNIIQ